MTDESTEQTEVMEPEPKGPKRLLRSRDDRMIAGVAGGLAKYFDVDPVIFRIGFAVSVFFGGLGLLAYVALALFVPSEAADGSVEEAAVQRSRPLAIAAGIGLLIIVLSWGALDFGPFGWGDGHGWFLGPPLFLLALGAAFYFIFRNTNAGGLGGVLLRILLALLVTAGLLCLAFVSAWTAATGHGVAIAVALIAIGAMLVAAAFAGGARWLIVPAVALAVPLGAVAASDIRFSDGIGERHYRPASFASVPADGYELGIGELLVDLRELPWTETSTLDLNVDLGMGRLAVAVPEDVCVSADVSTTAGDLDIAGQRADGIDAEIRPEAPSTARPLLNLTGEVDLGELRVVNLDDAELDPGHGPWRFGHQDDDEMRAAMDAACAAPAAGETSAGADEAGTGDRKGDRSKP
jgi:phage shock protein PspC (stress-responsive transcriptional regulator)/predicted membrane protein